MFDPHIHASPDLIKRCMDDIDVARTAASAGMRGVLIKSHVESTVGRAYLTQKILRQEGASDFRVLGGLVLNHETGGLNPAAVEASLSMGAAEIWMPTLSAAHNFAVKGKDHKNGIAILQDGKLPPEMYEILSLIAEKNAVLGTGHLSVEEITILVREAKKQGVKKILITHPDSPTSGIPIDVQIELKTMGAFFERCYLPVALEAEVSEKIFKTIVSAIRSVGIGATVLATDLGRANLLDPVRGMSLFLERLSKERFSDRELLQMGGETIWNLFGLS